MTRTRALAFALLLALPLAGGVVTFGAHADDHRYSDDDDHVRAREAVRSGAALPLAEILAALAPRFGGKVIEVELEREDGRPVYELTLVGADGVVREILVDAKTAQVLELEIDDDRDDD
ncbi:PepSY domain-containing protein [Salinarimonas ramus]|nr:PepSY domain-containing protein [Salinarimonas ramus]